MCINTIISVALFFQPMHFEVIFGKDNFYREEREDIRDTLKNLNRRLDVGRLISIGFFSGKNACTIGNEQNEICFVDFSSPQMGFAIKKHNNPPEAYNGVAFNKHWSDCDIFLSENFLKRNPPERFDWESLLQVLSHEILHCRGFEHRSYGMMATSTHDNTWNIEECQLKEYRQKHYEYHKSY